MKSPIIIGSRGSDLALWQARFVSAELKKLGLDSEIKIIKTQGDRIQDLSFDKLEGKGFFTKEIEDALLERSIDLAIHSHKDLPTSGHEDLVIAAVSDREDPSDILLINPSALDHKEKFNLKKNAIVGTSSSRRKSQLLSYRPDVQIRELRGNVPTRIRKLAEGQYDAILLANAGVERLQLDLSMFHKEILDKRVFVPAPAQGVLALQIHKADNELANALKPLNNPRVAKEIAFERKVLNLLDGGCQLPLGVYCRIEDEKAQIYTAKARNWNEMPIRLRNNCKADDSPENVAGAIINKIVNTTPSDILITRELEADSYLKRSLEEHGYKVHGISLLKFEAIPFAFEKRHDWIFFPSRNAVRFFFSNPIDLTGIKIAAIGSGTAEALKKIGHQPDFTGNGGNTLKIAAELNSLIKNKRILFIQAEEASGNIRSALTDCEISELIVYRSLPAETSQVPHTKIVVFTSPRNAEEYLKISSAEGKTLIAIGETTSSALHKNGLPNHITAFGPDELGLAETIYSL